MKHTLISILFTLFAILPGRINAQDYLGAEPAEEQEQNHINELIAQSNGEENRKPSSQPTSRKPIYIPLAKNKGAQIAVVVNKEVITYQDVYDRAALVLLSKPDGPTEADYKKVIPQVKSSLIQERIQLQVCKELKIIISDNEVNNSLKEIAQQNNMSLDDMKRIFSERGVNIKTLENRTRAQLGWMRAVREVFGQLAIVSEKEAMETLERTRKDLNKTRHELLEIVMYVDDPKHDSQVKGELNNIIENLKSGAPFRILAQQFSQSTSASNGGYLGWFSHGTRSQAEEEALSKLTPGQFTQPIRFSGGYRILYLKDIQKPGEAPQSESKLTFFTGLIPYSDSMSNSEKEMISLHVDDLKENVKDCDQFKRKMKEFNYHMEEPITIQFADLSEPMEKLFANAKVGQVLGPIRAPQTIIMHVLCKRENAGKFKEQTLDDITNQLQSQKLERMATREFNKIHSSAFVDDKMGNPQ